ncbi:hypothetical protein BJY01DRAFT_172296 [Aspergillus pseudoustus]|uniref:Uncharacterized protein n=1 Tax=Aspergillus pseudoustus TaxID=1810923 RepID=A0ABR4K3F2_9EURO
MSHQKIKSVIFKANSELGQELNIWKTSPDGQPIKRVFGISKQNNAFLYDSPPVIHPTSQLVVWAVSGFSIIFIDVEHDEFREERITSTGEKRGMYFLASLDTRGEAC